MKFNILNHSVIALMLAIGSFSCMQNDFEVLEVEKENSMLKSHVESEAFYYKEDGNKECFKIRRDKVIIKTTSAEVAKILCKQENFVSAFNVGYWILGSIDSLKTNLDFFMQMPEIIDVTYGLEYADGTLIYPTKVIAVNMKDGISYDEVIDKIGLTQNVESVELVFSDFNYYYITFDNRLCDILLISRNLFETGFCINSTPVFFRELKLHNTHYNEQWGLNNTGQLNGTYGIDIKAELAWNLTRGNANIKVAVIDTGVELTHYDLQPNIVSGYDAVPTSLSPGGSYGSPYIAVGTPDNAHGTACAGIIAAVNNTSGIVGVASSCKIMPIRVGFVNPITGLYVSNDAWKIDGINHAWQNGADVISISWSYGAEIPAVTTAINSATTNGRPQSSGSPRGCVIVCSSGNDNKSSINHPAKLQNVISVGAINRNGNRVGYSNYGTGLKVVAPGYDIYTTDIEGQPGYVPGAQGDYFSQFNGTSAAAPHVAGVAALVLSMKPDLTQKQVRDIIESTCTKLPAYSFSNNSSYPNGTWNNQVGYGLLNAFAAVFKTINATLTPSTSNKILCSGSTFDIFASNAPAGFTWACSSNVNLSGSGANTRTVTASSNSGPGWVSIRLGSVDLVKYDFWVHAPVLSYIQGPSSTPSYTYTTFRAEYDPISNPTNSWQWFLSPPNGSSLSAYGREADAYLLPGDYQITVRVSNVCGVSDYISTRVYAY